MNPVLNDLYHYSGVYIEKLDSDWKYDQDRYRFHAKPYGLWLSIGTSWKEWCVNERYCLENLKYCYKVKLKTDSNILFISTAEEIFELSKKYPRKTNGFDFDPDTYELNWLKIKEDYQGIIISPYQWECRLSLESSWYYGWDCSSGCIWDLDIIESITLENEMDSQIDSPSIISLQDTVYGTFALDACPRGSLMNKWINVEEYLPDAEKLVLVADNLNDFISLGKLIDDDEEYCFQLMYIDHVEIDSFITHWMPLPEPPKE